VPRLPELYARTSPHLAHRRGAALASQAHAWLLRRSQGRAAGHLLGADVLRSKGRRAGELRESPAFFVAHEDAIAVVAANAAPRRHPAWWLNLQANPDADETASLWPKLTAAYSGYDHYKSIATRELPVVLLEPR
jgi:hypothetical protein